MRKLGYFLCGYLAKRVGDTGKREVLLSNRHHDYNSCFLIAMWYVEGIMDGDVFYHFVQSSLLPQLMVFNGTNSNSFHHTHQT